MNEASIQNHCSQKRKGPAIKALDMQIYANVCSLLTVTSALIQFGFNATCKFWEKVSLRGQQGYCWISYTVDKFLHALNSNHASNWSTLATIYNAHIWGAVITTIWGKQWDHRKSNLYYSTATRQPQPYLLVQTNFWQDVPFNHNTCTTNRQQTDK